MNQLANNALEQRDRDQSGTASPRDHDAPTLLVNKLHLLTSFEFLEPFERGPSDRCGDVQGSDPRNVYHDRLSKSLSIGIVHTGAPKKVSGRRRP